MDFHAFDNGDLGKIFIPKHDIDPQEWAMLAAMYSRTTDSCEEMVEKVSTNGAHRFMETYFVGYGHESIGDLVDVKIFLEGIPLFLAPLIEHYALFRGQECSTRYIDFSKQRFYGEDQDLLEAQRLEYLRALEAVTGTLMVVNKPQTKVQSRAIQARAFDICRGLIPLGATTNVAWYGDMRGIKGHLAWMMNVHAWSTPWVKTIYDALKSVYPASMEKELSAIRPRQPWVFDVGNGLVSLSGTMDFGSWRDLNRHRVGRHSNFSLPNPLSRINPWYESMLEKCGHTIDRDLDSRRRFKIDKSCRLLGQEIYFSYEMPYSQAEYFCRLRNQMTVHPTLRIRAEDLAVSLGHEIERVPDVGLGYIEIRGKQTIIHKGDLPGEESAA